MTQKYDMDATPYDTKSATKGRSLCGLEIFPDNSFKQIDEIFRRLVDPSLPVLDRPERDFVLVTEFLSG